MRISCGVGPLTKARSRFTALGVMVTAAFVAFSVGRGFSSLGAGGGRAAICGEEASGDRSAVEGITTGGESARGGVTALSCRDKADIMAHRGLET